MAGKSAEERLKLIDQKIEAKQAELQRLEEQRQKLLHPIKYRDIIARAKEIGMSPEEIADRLGFEF